MLNYVAIIPDQSDIVDNYAPHLTYQLTGKVVALPQNLVYLGYEKLTLPTSNNVDLARHREISEQSLEWDTNLEVKVGDTVYFRLVNLLKPSDEKYFDMSVEINGEMAQLMLYSELIAKVEGDSLVPLNGYILVEPKMEQHELAGAPVRQARSFNEGVVKYIGKPNFHYLFEPTKLDLLDVKVGDTIIYPRTASIRLETENMRRFGNNTALDRLQRKDIYGIL